MSNVTDSMCESSLGTILEPTLTMLQALLDLLFAVPAFVGFTLLPLVLAIPGFVGHAILDLAAAIPSFIIYATPNLLLAIYAGIIPALVGFVAYVCLPCLICLVTVASFGSMIMLWLYACFGFHIKLTDLDQDDSFESKRAVGLATITSSVIVIQPVVSMDLYDRRGDTSDLTVLTVASYFAAAGLLILAICMVGLLAVTLLWAAVKTTRSCWSALAQGAADCLRGWNSAQDKGKPQKSNCSTLVHGSEAMQGTLRDSNLGASERPMLAQVVGKDLAPTHELHATGLPINDEVFHTEQPVGLSPESLAREAVQVVKGDADDEEYELVEREEGKPP